MSGELIMVVDDNPVFLKLLWVMLTKKGYKICTAADANEAMVVLESVHPRLILMDVQLPDIDGLTLTRQLKANPATQDILIVALTAHVMQAYEQKALDAGCEGFITKPIEPPTFITTLEHYLELQAEKRLEREISHVDQKA
ncbi:MAG: response regulator [Ktedonobacteraceae bacterium]